MIPSISWLFLNSASQKIQTTEKNTQGIYIIQVWIGKSKGNKPNLESENRNNEKNNCSRKEVEYQITKMKSMEILEFPF